MNPGIYHQNQLPTQSPKQHPNQPPGQRSQQPHIHVQNQSHLNPQPQNPNQPQNILPNIPHIHPHHQSSLSSQLPQQIIQQSPNGSQLDIQYYYNYPLQQEPGPHMTPSYSQPSSHESQQYTPTPPVPTTSLRPNSLNQQPQHDQQRPPTQDQRKRLHSSAVANRSAAAYPRKRAVTACDTCRIKKVKCDNVRPRCGSCMRNGITNCHYRTDDLQKDYSSYDPASLNILGKLDLILRDLNEIKINASQQPVPKPKEKAKFSHSKSNLEWDMSITSVLNWEIFKSALNLSQSDVNKSINQLINYYSPKKKSIALELSWQERIGLSEQMENLLESHLPNLMHSFFINCHTKIPVLDIIEVMELIETYKILKSYDESLNFAKILQMYEKHFHTFENSNKPETDNVPREFLEALKKLNIKDEPYRRSSFFHLCKSIPLILLMCAIGVLATSIQLGNLEKFDTSLEEMSDLEIGCLAEKDIPKDVPKSRYKIAHILSEYSKFLLMMYPQTIEQYSLPMIELHLLRSQYELYLMCPLQSYECVTDACQNMMYYLEKHKVNFGLNEEDIYEIPQLKKDRTTRLFWCCLKLESELRIELSPFVPISGITLVTPPASFPTVPDSEGSQHSETAITLASKYEDQFSWYYYLTEVAVRKVDNMLIEEVYCSSKIDEPEFYLNSFWGMFIKYSDQYNGIINSMNPKIREFILLETNVEQVYKRVKRRYDKKKANKPENPADILDQLEDFLVDDDTLVQAQSECIIFIKTRILTSKLMLMRPIMYMLLNDYIPLVEMITAAMSVVQEINTLNTREQINFHSFESPETSSTYTSSSNEFPDLQAPLFYQKHHPEEDFEGMIEEVDGEIRLKDASSARIKILKLFLQNLISIPKLNIPKMIAHRHPGSWYVLRNTFIGNICQVLLYKKLQKLAGALITDEKLQVELGQATNGDPSIVFEMLDKLVSKEMIQSMLEHSIIGFEYWKDEVRDCEVYYEYAKKLLEIL